jgi:hypothetical protein
MTVQAYPLKWPHARKRTPQSEQRVARFSKKQAREGGWSQSRPLTLHEALTRLLEELQRIEADGVVISSNLELRNDGFPRSGQRKPADCGVCVYFSIDGKPRALPCDTYNTVEGNIAAVAAHIEATRTIERNGVATVSEMFAGFMALPAPSEKKRAWHHVLGISAAASKAEVEAAYRNLAKKAHPDNGGSTDAMAELNQAKQEALA